MFAKVIAGSLADGCLSMALCEGHCVDEGKTQHAA